MNIQLEEMHRARYEGRSVELSCPQACLPSTSVGSATQKLSKPHTLGIFMETSLYRNDKSLTQSPDPHLSLKERE